MREKRKQRPERRKPDGRFFDDFRALVARSGKTMYEISRDTNGAVDRSSLYRFMNGQRSLSPKALEAVADQLGIRPTIAS